MSKLIQKEYLNSVEVLKTDHYVANPIMVSDTGINADTNGKKIVKAGSILDKDGSIVNDATAVGVLLADVDVTYGPKEGALVVHGYIDGTKLPVDEIDKDVLLALPMIKFYDITVIGSTNDGDRISALETTVNTAGTGLVAKVTALDTAVGELDTTVNAETTGLVDRVEALETAGS